MTISPLTFSQAPKRGDLCLTVSSIAFSMSPLSQLHFSGRFQLCFPFSHPQLCGKFGHNKLPQGRFPQNVPHKPWLPEKHPDIRCF